MQVNGMAVNCCNWQLMPRCFADCVDPSAANTSLGESVNSNILDTTYSSKSCFNIIQTRGSTTTCTLRLLLIFYSDFNDVIVK